MRTRIAMLTMFLLVAATQSLAQVAVRVTTNDPSIAVFDSATYTATVRTATCSATFLTAGVHAITGTFSGNGVQGPSTGTLAGGIAVSGSVDVAQVPTLSGWGMGLLVLLLLCSAASPAALRRG
jgi:hypothetical protein